MCIFSVNLLTYSRKNGYFQRLSSVSQVKSNPILNYLSFIFKFTRILGNMFKFSMAYSKKLLCQLLLYQIMNNNNLITTQNELLQLFNSIKVDKSKEAIIQKSTLLSLLIYHNVDSQYPEYFRYVSRSLQRFKKTTITQQEFLKIFMNPQIQLALADKNELADAFSVLDPNKTGSIDVNQFLQVYRMSQNYQKLSKQKRDQAEDQIKQAFFSASEDGKITPMDFYHIVKFR